MAELAPDLAELSVYRSLLRALGADLKRKADRLWVYLDPRHGLDASGEVFDLPPVETGEDQGLPGRAARTGVAILCDDVVEDRNFNSIYRPLPEECRSQWCFPLNPGWSELRIEPRRVLCVESHRARGIDRSKRRLIDMLRRLAGMKILALHGARILKSFVATSDANDRWQLDQEVRRLAGIRAEYGIRCLWDALAENIGAQGISYWHYSDVHACFCHPIMSSGSPASYRESPRPGLWGMIGRVFDTGEPRFVADVARFPPLEDSRFVGLLGVRATAYVPACPAEIGCSFDEGEPARHSTGILFINFEQRHEFPDSEQEWLRASASAAAAVLEVRARCRHLRLQEDFDLGALAYPANLRPSQPAIKAVLRLAAPQLGYAHGGLYVRDRLSYVFLRWGTSDPVADGFPNRYLDQHPLCAVLAGRKSALVISPEDDLYSSISVPTEQCSAPVLVVPVREDDELLALVILAGQGREDRHAGRHAIGWLQEAVGTLIDLDRQAHGQSSYISLLGQLLRIYEYAAKEITPLPLLEAFLDAWLEGSTADAVHLFRGSQEEGSEGDPRQLSSTWLDVARGAVDSPGTREGSKEVALPADLEAVLESGEPRFQERIKTPGETLATVDPRVQSRAILPLLYRGEKLGVLCVEFHAWRLFSSQEQWLFRLLAHQLAQTLHFFRDHAVLLDEVRSLAETGTRISDLGSPDFEKEVPVFEEAQNLAVQARKSSKADYVELYVRQDNELVLLAAEGATESRPDQRGTPWNTNQGVVGWVFHHGRPVLLEDVTSPEAGAFGYVSSDSHPETRSELVAPVRSGKEVLAIINLESKWFGAFNEGHIRFVEALTAHAVALWRARELQRIRRQVTDERKLLVKINDIAHEAARSGRGSVLHRILEALHGYIKDADLLSIHLRADDGYGFPADLAVSIPPDARLYFDATLSNSILGLAVRQAEAGESPFLLLPDVTQLPPNYPPYREQPNKPKRMAELVIPIGPREDVVGVINVEHREPERLAEHVELIRAVVAGVYNALQLASVAERSLGSKIQDTLAGVDDDLLQTMASTVFHDMPQMVDGLENRLLQVDRALATASEDRGHLVENLQEIRASMSPTLDRLKRLSKVLPARLRPDRLDLVALARETLESANLTALPAYDRDHCEVVVTGPEQPIYIYESKEWIQQILENLAVNSFRALAEDRKARPGRNKGKLLVSVGISDEGRLAVVEVEDNGPGMPEGLAKSLGSKRVEHEGPPGIALGIFHKLARRLVARRGGNLQLIKNEPGSVVFQLRYPILREEVELEAEERSGTSVRTETHVH